MLEEVLELLGPKPAQVILDATLGGAGHAREMLKRILPGGVLFGFDADPSAIEAAKETLKDFAGSFKLLNRNFRELAGALDDENVPQIDAALFDIGISSNQMDDASRGFSIKSVGPLDMRMDPRSGSSASDIVNRLKEEELSQIIRDLGEERFHRRIARAIAEARRIKKIETTGDLAEIIYKAVGGRYQKSRIDPATRTFQAIRIAVNDELGALKKAIEDVVPRIKPGGRIAVISFHSLEDRIVKNTFKRFASENSVRIITKKPIRPSEDEVTANPRSRSGRLRVAERI